jgi:hypothetical protein
MCTLIFVSVVGLYGFTIYVSVVNDYSPFSSSFSLRLARGLAVLQAWCIPTIQNAQRIASAISFHNHPPLPRGQQADADADTHSLHSNEGVATPVQPHNPNSAEKSSMVLRSRAGIDPHTHVHVLERLVTTTAEAIENIPIFLELLDQPVKDLTLRPFNMDKWKELLHITFRLLRDQPTFSVSASWTLARTMMICYDHQTADQQLNLIIHHHSGNRETDNQRPRMQLNLLFSSYLGFRLDYSSSRELCRTIAFLEPSDAADAELLWMVNTSHWLMVDHSVMTLEVPSTQLFTYLRFFTAVLTYISSTERSRRTKAPLTAAVIYALHTIRSAHNKDICSGWGFNPIEGLYILPGTVSTSDLVPMTFCRADGIHTLDLWSDECVGFIKDLLAWNPQQSSYTPHAINDIRLSLISALYIDNTKQAHTRSTFVELLGHTSITDFVFGFSDAYDRGIFAVYLYMAVTRKLLNEYHGPLPCVSLHDVYRVIEDIITKSSTLQLSELRVLEIAVNHVQKTASTSSDWLRKDSRFLIMSTPGHTTKFYWWYSNHWVLLHLDTLLAPKPYRLLEGVVKLEWSDTPEKVHIANARLDLYDTDAGHEGAKGPKPDPELLRVFLGSKIHGLCTRAFKWCLDLVPISQSGTPGGADSASMFNPETMGYEWIEHLIHVLCKDEHLGRAESWRFLMSCLVPKWTVLPSPWCYDFASALLFSVVQPRDMHGLPAYQCLAEAHERMLLVERRAFLPFLATLLELVNSSLSWVNLISLENWLARLPASLKNADAHAQMNHILATRMAQLNLEVFATELPMDVTVTSL